MRGGLRFVGLALAAVGCVGCVRTYTAHFSVGNVALDGERVFVEITCEKTYTELFKWDGTVTGVADRRVYTLEFAPAGRAGKGPEEMHAVARLPAAPAAGGGPMWLVDVKGHAFGDHYGVVGRAEDEGRVLYLLESRLHVTEAADVAIADESGDILHRIEIEPGDLYSFPTPEWWDAAGRRVLLAPWYDDESDQRRGRRHMTVVVWHYDTRRLETLRLDVAGALYERGAWYIPRRMIQDQEKA